MKLVRGTHQNRWLCFSFLGSPSGQENRPARMRTLPEGLCSTSSLRDAPWSHLSDLCSLLLMKPIKSLHKMRVNSIALAGGSFVAHDLRGAALRSAELGSAREVPEICKI